MNEVIKGLLLRAGYIEEQGLSLIPVHHRTGFPIPEEALHNFAKSLIEVKNEIYPTKHPCSQCGQGREETISAGQFFKELFGETLDSTSRINEMLRDRGWAIEGYLAIGEYVVVHNFDGYLDSLESRRDPSPSEGIIESIPIHIKKEY